VITKRPAIWREIAAYAGFWTILGLLSAAQEVVTSTYTGQRVDLGFIYGSSLLNWWTCGIGTPIYVWLVRRYPLQNAGARIVPIAFLYLLVMAASIVLKYVVWVPIENALYHLNWNLQSALVPSFFGVGMDQVYFLILLYAVEYYRTARERQLAASQLEAQLTQAQLEVLRAQLHPHFLFNTLNSISALMHKDVNAADEMLSRLSDMLRITLEAQSGQEVRLKDELQALDLYLQIMAVRFGDRLTTKVLVDEPLFNDRVPSFLLQPLVENAVRHGISESNDKTNVQIVGTADDATLTLRVIDDGSGLPVARAIKEGIGLGNTRRRLEQLYGDAGKLVVGNRDGGGTEVVIQIPRRSTALA
jgi:sensor histidine kinase YesM